MRYNIFSHSVVIVLCIKTNYSDLHDVKILFLLVYTIDFICNSCAVKIPENPHKRYLLLKIMNTPLPVIQNKILDTRLPWTLYISTAINITPHHYQCWPPLFRVAPSCNRFCYVQYMCLLSVYLHLKICDIFLS